MNIICLSCALLYFVFSVDCTVSPSWIDSLTEYISEETNAQQVILMSNLAPNERIESRIIDELFVKIVQNIPTIRINIVGLHDSNDLPLLAEIEIDEKSPISDTSTTFFILVHESHEILGYLPSNRIIDVLLEISASKYRSKFLLVLVSPVLSDGLEDLLRHAWTKLLLDFTLVELTEFKAPGKLLVFDYSVTIPIIHQLNLFKNEYTRNNWTSSVEWFPDKVKNMWGHPLKIGVIHVPPFSIAKFNDYQRPFCVYGPNIKLLKIIAGLLNFSLNYQPKLTTFMEINANRNPTGLYNLMLSGKIDIIAYLFPHYIDDVKYNTLRTAMVKPDKLCPVVPVLPSVKLPFPMDFFEAYIVSFVIVGLFWIIKRALRFKYKMWQPFNILRVLFGVTVTRKPEGAPERLLFACLLLVSAIYSSNIYVALTNISLDTNAEMEFESFEDLVNSELTPIMNSYVYNKTFNHAERPLKDLMSRVVYNYEGMHKCLEVAATYKNVSCIMGHEEATIWVRTINRRGGGQIKIAAPCFWSDSTGFLLALGSPYRSRIDGILGIIQSSGLLEKLYKEGITNVASGSSGNVEENSGLDTKENMNGLRRHLIAIAVVGYAVSLFTFAVEILVDRALKHKRRNVKTKVKNLRTYVRKSIVTILAKTQYR